MQKNDFKIILILLVIAIISFSLYLLKKENILKKTIKNNEQEINNITNNKTNDETKGDVNLNINVVVGNKVFPATLENNEISKKFISMLPLEINMIELNDNEKYYNLDKELPTNSYNQKKINSGDIMLYGNKCLVLFYKTFNTSYSYTKLGSINNPKDLESALGNGNVIIRFESR